MAAAVAMRTSLSSLRPQVRPSSGSVSRGGGAGPLSATLGESQGCAVEYLLQHMLPLLKPLVDELCLRDASRRSSLLSLWLLERSGVPQELLQPLKELIEDPNGMPLNPKSPSPGPEVPKAKASDAGHLKIDAKGSKTNSPVREQPKVMEETPSKVEKQDKRVQMWASVNSDHDELPQEEAHVEEVDSEKHANLFDRGRSSVLTADSAAKRQKRRMSMRGSNSNLEEGPSSPKGGDDGAVKTQQRRFTVNMGAKVGLQLPPFHEIMELLKKVPAFACLPEEDLVKVVGIAKSNKYEIEENLIAHGYVADDVHIIMDGLGKVSVPYQICSYKPGDFFGEESLRLAAATSQVQVSAAGGPLTTLSINGAAFKALNINKSKSGAHGLKKDRLKGGAQNETGDLRVARETGLCPDSGLPVILDYQPTKADREVISMAVKNNRMLGGVLELTEQQCDLIADSVYLVGLKAGRTLMTQGDKGTALYIVQEGLLDVHFAGSSDVPKLRTGDSFGELALLYDTPRSATIVGAKDCDLWVLTRPDYKLITSLAYKARIEEYVQLLRQIPTLTKMVQDTHLDMIADVVEKITFYDEDEVCCEGEDEGLLFLIFEGECDVIQGGVVKRHIKKGDWVGEEQVVTGTVSLYTVKPTCDHVTALVLDTNSLVTVMRVQSEMAKSQQWADMQAGARETSRHRPSLSLQNAHLDHAVKNEFADEFLKQRLCQQVNKHRKKAGDDMNSIDEDGSGVNISNCKRLAVLGEGTYGSVILLEDKDNKQMYALKALSKHQIMEENMGAQVTNERNIILMLDSEFVVKCYETYQDKDNLFFMLEPVLGGEVFDVYTENDFWGKMPEARFYFACVVFGLQHMHSKRVVYRDLKLENCILDAGGYLKLTDLGIAKVVMGKTYTVCGTADYFAPETLRQVGHDRAVDWWAAGVLLFIMATGRSPFDAPQVTQIYKNIMKGFSKVAFPETVPSDCTEVVKSLCRKKPEERVTMQKGGVATLQEMGFFMGLDWEQLLAKQLPAPFQPKPFELSRLKDKKLTREIDLDSANVVPWDGSLS